MTPRGYRQPYIGGNYRDLTRIMTHESSSDTMSILTTVEGDISEVRTSEEENLPEGATYPLNSKRLITSQLRRLTAMLELPSDGTSATLRQLIEWKLIELGQEPRTIQVIVASADSKLYLVGESGIIKQELEHVNPGPTIIILT